MYSNATDDADHDDNADNGGDADHNDDADRDDDADKDDDAEQLEEGAHWGQVDPACRKVDDDADIYDADKNADK